MRVMTTAVVNLVLQLPMATMLPPTLASSNIERGRRCGGAGLRAAGQLRWWQLRWQQRLCSPFALPAHLFLGSAGRLEGQCNLGQFQHLELCGACYMQNLLSESGQVAMRVSLLASSARHCCLGVCNCPPLPTMCNAIPPCLQDAASGASSGGDDGDGAFNTALIKGKLARRAGPGARGAHKAAPAKAPAKAKKPERKGKQGRKWGDEGEL